MSTMTAPRLQCHLRWMLRQDLPAVVAIESDSFDFPWSEEEFIRCLRHRTSFGLVAEHSERVVGYALYEVRPQSVWVLNLAVHPHYRRQGIGRQLLSKLLGNLNSYRRRTLRGMVVETNLPAQLFLRSAGLKAIRLKPRPYEETEYDGYVFEYRTGGKS